MVSSLPKNPAQNPASDVQSLIGYAMQEGVLRRRDHLTLATAMLSDATLTARDRQHINQVFDGLRSGRVRLTD
jgi:hypothetical protein